jgi:hypothetical protein
VVDQLSGPGFSFTSTGRACEKYTTGPLELKEAFTCNKTYDRKKKLSPTFKQMIQVVAPNYNQLAIATTLARTE